MAIRIEAVSLSRNPVSVKESFIISVAIVTHGYLENFTHKELAAYTNGQLRLRGESALTHKQLSRYRHAALHDITHQQIATMEVEDE